MFSRHRLLALGLTLILGLAACQSGAAPAVQSPTATAIPTRDATALPSPTSVTPEPTKPAVGRLENGGLMLQYHDASSQTSLVLVDVRNGGAIAGHNPLDIDAVGGYLYSPDQKQLAIVEYSQPDRPEKPSLLLLDIASWKLKEVALPLNGWVQTLAMSPDGSRIAVATAGAKDNLGLVDTREMAVIASTTIPNFVRGLGFSQDGQRLMAYASNEDPLRGLSLGAPQALLLSATDLSTLWQTNLSGVRDGFTPGDNFQGDPYAPGTGTRYLPGLAFSPVMETLYVVHADEDRFSSVDFTTRRVKEIEIHPKLGFLDRLVGLGSGVVYAKGQNGTEKQAAISADGTQLYVTGVEEHFVQKENGNWDLSQEALGLKVVDPSRGEEVLTLDTKTNQVAVLPDGKLLLRSVLNEEPTTDIFDPGSGSLVDQYDGLYHYCVPLIAGGYALGPATFYGSQYDSRAHDIQVFDPKTGKPMGSWRIASLNSQWVGCTP